MNGIPSKTSAPTVHQTSSGESFSFEIKEGSSLRGAFFVLIAFVIVLAGAAALCCCWMAVRSIIINKYRDVNGINARAQVNRIEMQHQLLNQIGQIQQISVDHVQEAEEVQIIGDND